MGAEQSSQQAQAATARRKTCYYELLGVDRDAADDEIRRAYKRKALELHPDRNLDDTVAATRKFAEVQTAYEILSDPQERAWYDSHRDAILGGFDEDEIADLHQAGSHRPTGRLTTPEHIFALMGRFNSAVRFTDDAEGFFGILNSTFDQLKREEAEACSWDSLTPPDFPSFGRAGDSYDLVARPFYNAWSSFSTKKSFSWKDKYRLSDAPDRRIRRLMEKENRKLRDEAARDFNDAVRSLVAFIKKRDPRYVPSTQSEADRQRVLRDLAAAQAARSRAANQEKLADFGLPDWAKSGNPDQHASDFSASEEESEIEQIECVVCNKLFKSEKQFEAHERSKKHIKAVRQMRRQMKREDVDFDLEARSTDSPNNAKKSPGPQPDASESSLSDGETDRLAQSRAGGARQVAEHFQEEVLAEPGARQSDSFRADPQESLHSDSGDYAPRDAVASRIAGGQMPQTGTDSGADSEIPSVGGIQISDGAATKKVGKARAKREKKAARQAANDTQDKGPECLLCHATFPSRNELFAHIRETGHVGPASATSSTKKR